MTANPTRWTPHSEPPAMKNKLYFLTLVSALLLGGAFFYLKGKRFDLVITQSQIDAGLSERFPATKEFLLVFSLTYANPQVTLLEDRDRVLIALEATLNLRIEGEPKNLSGSVAMTTAIRYDSETQDFFLDDAVFERLAIQGVPDKWLAKVTEVASLAAQEFLEAKPIYRLEAKDAKSTAAKLLLKGFEVRNQALHVTLGI